jgi:hypothetical protein
VISLDLTDDQLAYLRVQQAKDQAEYEQLRQQKQRFGQQQQPHGALGRSTGGGIEEDEDEDEYVIDEDEDEVEIETYQEVEFSIAQNGILFLFLFVF